jgi:FkbM family methyltransferase
MTPGSILSRLLKPFRRHGECNVLQAVERGQLAFKHVAGTDLRWLITNPDDEIQSRQIAHGFYELAELEQLRADAGPRNSVLDVGANIGNHSVFFITRMSCNQLLAIEPFDPALRHLMINLALNRGETADIQVICAALGNAEGTGSIVPPSRFNIGLTSISLGEGMIHVVRGDDIVGSRQVDLIKIDVEGMEVSVVEGLVDTIRRCKPAIYVEATSASADRISELLYELGYRLARQSAAYETQLNLTFLPV